MSPASGSASSGPPATKTPHRTDDIPRARRARIAPRPCGSASAGRRFGGAGLLCPLLLDAPPAPSGRAARSSWTLRPLLLDAPPAPPGRAARSSWTLRPLLLDAPPAPSGRAARGGDRVHSHRPPAGGAVPHAQRRAT